MTDSYFYDLPYGLYGEATYDPEEQVWNFQRTPDPEFYLRQLGEVKIHNGAERDLSIPERYHSNQKPRLRYASEINSLVQYCPEIQPAASLLPSFLRLAESVEQGLACQDSLEGSLLDHGSIFSNVLHAAIHVVVFACGLNGCNVKIARIRPQRQGWDDTKKMWIEYPVLHGETATWNGPGAPIQQVCLAHCATERLVSCLAVRLPNQTIILRPVHRSKPAALNLSTTFILAVEDVSHAHVTFNPWYPRQFAVVDVKGKWSVWELDKHYGRGKLVSSGELRASEMVQDGWARLQWVLNFGLLAVCNREHLVLVTVPEDDSNSPVASTVKVRRCDPVGWILDMVILPSHTSHIFLLTTSHLIIYHVTDESTAKEVLCLRHYRSPENTSLSMLVVRQEHTEDFIVLIRSAIDPVVQLWPIRLSIDGKATYSDAGELRLPNSKPLSGWALLGTSYNSTDETLDEVESSKASQYQTHEITFKSMLTLQRDLTLNQTLYVQIPCLAAQVSINAPTWARTLRKRHLTATFILDDDEVVDAVNAGDSVDHNPSSSFLSLWRSSHTSTQGGQVTDLTLASKTYLTQPIQTEIDTIQPQSDPTSLPSKTLREASLLTEPKVNDMEAASAHLTSLSLALTTTPREASLPSRELQDIYRALLGVYLSPLAPSISGGVRLRLEGVVRTVAAEMALSARVLHPVGADEGRADEERDANAIPHPEGSFLGRRTWFFLPSTFTGAMARRRTRRLLSHWSVGEEPEGYDYFFERGRERETETETETETERGNDQEGERRKRKKEKKKKRVGNVIVGESASQPLPERTVTTVQFASQAPTSSGKRKKRKVGF
ncbi:hypothetical protein K470DRAFT_255702 [Piedraia hortae CBS 480.64]|uniref:RNA polymerase I-specific transcription initiation factor RRN6-like protein n=1 Tax=Piedraia hortae CBS 480.64 TaxID=1314780 RepID=A0A6A7C6B0_9PEZI|nr:hypothetical protein K470DRAFT_255702 [Piedraia hortae CBS 480.64]